MMHMLEMIKRLLQLGFKWHLFLR